MEIEIVADPPVLLGSRRQGLIRPRFQIVGQGIKGTLVNPAMQPQPFRTQTLPLADDFLPFGVIILPAQTLSVGLLGLTRADTGNDPQHDDSNINRDMARRKKMALIDRWSAFA